MCLLDTALEPVLDQAVKSDNPEQAILDLKVCDPACGSGHFLVATAHRMAKRLASVRSGDDEPSPRMTRHALRDIIGHCIYGVDINPMAVELCKVSLWMEAIEPGKPLSFLDHHIQCGNSLLGATPALLKKGIPDDAFKPIEGDDKAYCGKFKKINKEDRKGYMSLFDEAGEPWDRLGDLVTSLMNLDEIGDDTIDGVKEKQERYKELVSSTDYEFGRLWADAWCAAFVWKKTEAFAYPITEDVFRKIEQNPHSVPRWLKDEVKRIAKQYQFFHWHLVFPDVFRVPGEDEESENEQTGWVGGFDVVLGNPPWERIKLQEKEFFATRSKEIANAVNAAARKKLIARLKQNDPDLWGEWCDALRDAEGQSNMVRMSGLFPLCGRGDVNTYALFSELNRGLIGPRGRAGFIVPSAIATDNTTKFFFQDLLKRSSLHSLWEFENEGFFTAGKGHMLRFALITLVGDSFDPTSTDFFFQGQALQELSDPDRHFELTASDIALINPNTLTSPIFRWRRDAEINKAIYRRAGVLQREHEPDSDPWGVRFLAMLHMANDSGLFRTREQLEGDGWTLEGNIFTKDGVRFLPLIEAKMIYIWNHRHGDFGKTGSSERVHRLPQPSDADLADPSYLTQPYYWVAESDVDDRLDGKWSKNWMLGWRDVTDARASVRTVVASLVPRVGTGDTLLLMLPKNGNAQSVACMYANLCSFCLDYAARQKVGGLHLKYNVFRQLPILEPTSYTASVPWSDGLTIGEWLLPRILELAYTAWDLQSFALDCGYEGPPFKWDAERRFQLRCELDAAFFYIYSIERDDVDYIMDTFPIVKRKDEQKYREYRTKLTILEIYDRMKKAMETGKPYRTLLDPPPADPMVVHDISK